MKRLLAKLPRSSSGSRDASASSSASRLPFDIFEVSITDDGAGFSGLAVVSSAICFSGASKDDFMTGKISFRRGRAFSKSRTARIFHLFAQVDPFPQQLSSNQNARRIAEVRHDVARTRFRESFRNRRPRET